MVIVDDYGITGTNTAVSGGRQPQHRDQTILYLHVRTSEDREMTVRNAVADLPVSANETGCNSLHGPVSHTLETSR